MCRRRFAFWGSRDIGVPRRPHPEAVAEGDPGRMGPRGSRRAFRAHLTMRPSLFKNQERRRLGCPNRRLPDRSPAYRSLTRGSGAIDSEPMRDPLVHLHRWKLRRSPRNLALRLPPGPRSNSRNALLRPWAFPWRRGASGFSRFAPSAGAVPREPISNVRLSPCRTQPTPYAVKGSCAAPGDGESRESGSWDFSG